jgi:hypothetical protein
MRFYKLSYCLWVDLNLIQIFLHIFEEIYIRYEHTAYSIKSAAKH